MLDNLDLTSIQNKRELIGATYKSGRGIVYISTTGFQENTRFRSLADLIAKVAKNYFWGIFCCLISPKSVETIRWTRFFETLYYQQHI